MNIVENTKPAAKELKPLRYFHFSQNNSGGSFYINDEVAYHVIIQAHSAENANEIALDIGIYFDGCSSGRDCDCCGDRWSSQWYDEIGDETPLIYGDDPVTFNDMFTKPGEPVCYVYHYDGTKTTYSVPK